MGAGRGGIDCDFAVREVGGDHEHRVWIVRLQHLPVVGVCCGLRREGTGQLFGRFPGSVAQTDDLHTLHPVGVFSVSAAQPATTDQGDL